jgi:hypothetical protein
MNIVFTVALCFVAPAMAHHSSATLDLATPIWLKGVVVRYEARNPHVLVFLDVQGQGGHVARWTIDGPTVARLRQMQLARDFLKPGDAIEICGFPYRARAAEPTALHGHVLALPDGRLQAWGPYGRMDSCVRGTDPPQVWATLADTQPLGHQYWCRGLALANVPSAASRADVDAVTRRLKVPCD